MMILSLSFLAVASAFVGRAPLGHRARPRHAAEDAEDLEQMVQRKQYEVVQLEQAHARKDDPLRVRLGYAADEGCTNLTRALRRYRMTDDVQRIAVVADLKRMSPTAAGLPRAVAEVADMGALADAVAAWPVDAVMINTDGFSYGGSADDLRRACQLLRQAPRPQFVARELDLLARSADVDVAAGRDPSGSWTGAAAAPPPPPPSDEEDPTRPPTLCPVIMKDIVLHPLQVAQAAEAGACAVYLIACVVGAQLESLLGYATVMGLEAIVEVHTPEEVAFAVSVGATVIAVNNWDRTKNELHLNQAAGLRKFIPDNIVTIATGSLVDAEQVKRLQSAGFDAVILGRSLVREDSRELVATLRARELLRVPAANLGGF